jgi:hypothetical protein
MSPYCTTQTEYGEQREAAGHTPEKHSRSCLQSSCNCQYNCHEAAHFITLHMSLDLDVQIQSSFNMAYLSIYLSFLSEAWKKGREEKVGEVVKDATF